MFVLKRSEKMMVNLEMIEELKKKWTEVCQNAKKAADDCGRDFEDITVVAVSKTKPVEMLLNGQKAGIPVFGENYAQEMREKHQYYLDNNLDQPVWHFIGHLQTNKVKYLAPFVNIIHSVDSLKLAKEISKQAAKHDRTIDIMLQVNTSGETSKSGCEPNEVFELADAALEVENVNIIGLMTIGSFSMDEKVVRKEFTLLRSLRDKLIEKHGEENFKHLSMGMTGDYPIAIAEGATFVRVGTAIFGERDYSK